MLQFNRWHLLKTLAAIICILGISAVVLEYLIPAPPSKFVIATGTQNQGFQSIGNKYRESVARSGVELEVRVTHGAAENVDLLKDPASGVSVGLTVGGVSNSDQSPDLLSLGRIGYQVFWIFYRDAEAITDFRLLKGKRICLGARGQRSTSNRRENPFNRWNYDRNHDFSFPFKSRGSRCIEQR